MYCYVFLMELVGVVFVVFVFLFEESVSFVMWVVIVCFFMLFFLLLMMVLVVSVMWVFVSWMSFICIMKFFFDFWLVFF